MSACCWSEQRKWHQIRIVCLDSCRCRTFGGHDEQNQTVADQFKDGLELGVHLIDVARNGVVEIVFVGEMAVSVLVPNIEEPATVAGPSLTKQPIVKVAQRVMNTSVRVPDVLNELVEFFWIAVSED